MEIPAEVLTLVESQLRQLAKVNPRHRRALVQIGVRLFAELEASLKALKPGKYATAVTASVMARVRALLIVAAEQYGDEVARQIEVLHRSGGKRGRAALAEQVAAWDVEPKPTDATEAAAEILDPGLLEYHKASRKAYGEEVLAKMRRTLATGVLAEETIAQTAARIERDLEIPDWRAERIVRTETSFAYHRRQILDLIDQSGNDADDKWRKQLLAVHDNRTGDDSIFVDKQIRRLTEEFADNEGRRYQHPPNRPNDRESMIFVPVARLPPQP